MKEPIYNLFKSMCSLICPSICFNYHSPSRRSWNKLWPIRISWNFHLEDIYQHFDFTWKEREIQINYDVNYIINKLSQCKVIMLLTLMLLKLFGNSLQFIKGTGIKIMGSSESIPTNSSPFIRFPLELISFYPFSANI